MIIVIGGIKGGTGKTTIATNLAVINAATARKTLLIDTDDQQTSLGWSEQRSALQDFAETKLVTIFLSGSNIHKQIIQLAKDFDDIIIDVGGRESVSQRSALTIADVFVLPFQPSSFDLWTISVLMLMLEELIMINPKLKKLYVINRALTNNKDNQEAFELLGETGLLDAVPIFLGNRISYRSAASKGLGVVEHKPRDPKAIIEMTTLHTHIFNISKVYNIDIKSGDE